MNRSQLHYLSWLCRITIRGSMLDQHRLFIRYHKDVVKFYRINFRSGDETGFTAKYRQIGETALQKFLSPIDVLNTVTNLGAVIFRVSKYSDQEYDWVKKEPGEDLKGYQVSIPLPDSGKMGAMFILAYDHNIYPPMQRDPRYVVNA